MVAEAADGVEAVRLACHLKPDILLLDVSMPRHQALRVLRKLAACSLSLRTILLAPRSEECQIIEGIRLGACGAVAKESAAASIVSAIRKVIVGDYWVEKEIVRELVKAFQKPLRTVRLANKVQTDPRLNARQRRIVQDILAGRANRDIARDLSLSVNTVKHELTTIFHKLGVSNRLQLALFARDRGTA